MTREYETSFLLKLYRQLLTVRGFEEQVLRLYEKTLIPGIAHVSIGQEAVPVGVCAALNIDDYITSTHRGHGHCLAKGAEVSRMFAELFGKVDGYCQGKGGSMHIANQKSGNLGANGIVGGGISIATGAALSAKLQKNNRVSVSFFGDGALNQGILSESMNMASIWNLPIIFACENNQYGEYTPMRQVTAGTVKMRGEAYSIPSVTVDGMNVLAVYEATSSAVELARKGEGPSFLVFSTYRYYGHGMGDRNRSYRTREEESEWREKRDPIDNFKQHLLTIEDIAESDCGEIQGEVAQEIEKGIEFAQQAAYPNPEAVKDHVYAK